MKGKKFAWNNYYKIVYVELSVKRVNQENNLFDYFKIVYMKHNLVFEKKETYSSFQYLARHSIWGKLNFYINTQRHSKHTKKILESVLEIA